MKYLTEICYSIAPDLRSEIYPREQSAVVIEEIRDVLVEKIDLWQPEMKRSAVRLELCEYDERAGAQNVNKPELRSNSEPFLKVSMEFEVEQASTNGTVFTVSGSSATERPMSLVELEHGTRTILATFLGDQVCEILMLSQIARPGSLKLREGIVHIKELSTQKSWRQVRVLPSIYCQRKDAGIKDEKIPIPDYNFYDFRKFYTWLETNDLIYSRGANTSCKQSSYHHALVNMSYVFLDSNEISRLIFQMRILERIYAEGKEQKAEQLDSKIQIFLGAYETHKKRIKKMYTLRSLFVHGTANVRPFHHIQQFDIHSAMYPHNRTELFEASCFSFGLIIATLQKMYLVDRIDLSFGLHLD